jgi:hypothetical protein
VTIALTGAALVSLRQALNLEKELGLRPADLGEKFVTPSLTAKIATRLTERANAANWENTDGAVDIAMFIVIFLMFLIVIGLPW